MFNSLDTGKIAQDPTPECHSMNEHTLSIVRIKNTVCFIFDQNQQELGKQNHIRFQYVGFSKKRERNTKIAFTVSTFKLGHFDK